MQSRAVAGNHRTLLGAAFVANGDDVVKSLAGLDGIGYAARLVPADVDADLPHGCNGQRIECTGFEASALRLEQVAAHLI